ncbi:hypothetical protein ACRAWD_25755 [Caulobacter segnis]
MRYGENPHQKAAFYTFPNPRAGVATTKQLQSKELSYNNINDTDAAFELIALRVRARRPVPAHAHSRGDHQARPTRAGWRSAASQREAYGRALACDPTSATSAASWRSTRA